MPRSETALSPEARTGAEPELPETELPTRGEDTARRPQQAGSVQRSRMSSPPIDHPRTAEQSRRPRDPATPSPTSSEFGNPGGNWLG